MPPHEKRNSALSLVLEQEGGGVVRGPWLHTDVVVEPASDPLDRSQRCLGIAVGHRTVELVEKLGRLVQNRRENRRNLFVFKPAPTAEVPVHFVEAPTFDGGSGTRRPPP